MVVVWVTAFVLAVLVGGGVSHASHRWGCWKHANASINFYNGATGDYAAIFNEEARTDSNSWHNFTDLSLTAVGSSGTTDHVNAFSGLYGHNGWLGIAEILGYSGCTVRNGRARLNRSYLDSGSYLRTNRKHVACQEVGHLFGLNHNRGSSTTCMNDTILTAPQPNSHDQSLINSIY
jgi:hypothetical protein